MGNKEQIIERLRTIFYGEVEEIEDHEYDDPEDRKGRVMDFLKYYRCGDNLLHIAIGRGEIEGAKLLVDLGIDINEQGDMGNTALHYCVMFEREDLYKYLISKGARIDKRNEFGQLPSEMIIRK